MPKNIVIFFASPYTSKAKAETYKDAQGLFTAKCTHTNVTALRYLSWKLAQQERKIDAAYAFTTKEVRGAAWTRLLDELQETEYAISPIYFDESSTIEGSFNGINIMYDVLTKNYPVAEEITVHMDLTGGFRHSIILMLDLLRLMKFAGYKIGLITYTNFNEKRVETVNELVAMFDLLGGASDFINNGGVMQLKNYFSGKKQALELQRLLKTMENFSECIKSCSSVSDLLKAASKLKNSLEICDASLKNITTGISEQDEIFVKLIPTIQKEYADIFSCDNTLSSIPKLIRWCLYKGLLQQAATYATELLPVYIIDSGLLKINNSAVIEGCKKKSKAWSNWQVEFLKNYKCEQMSLTHTTPKIIISKEYNQLRLLIKEHDSAEEIRKLASEVSPNLNSFMKQTIKLDKEVLCKSANLVKALQKLPKDDIVRQAVNKVGSKNGGMENFISKQFKMCRSIERVLLVVIKTLDKNDFNNLFVENEQIDSEPVKNMPLRVQQILNACENRLLSCKLSEADLQIFIEKYLSIVQYRNTISHAYGATQGREGNLSLAQLIADELDLLEAY